jgi:putative N-acetylmannosamine-6-phosphate epimerase/predicted NBD/HSP70 family sugar kinase
MEISKLLDIVRHKLIVSVQAEGDFPLNQPHHLTALAQTAVIGGASAIRANEPANIRAMKQVLDVPIIGLYKKDYDGFDVRITPTIAEVRAIIEAGCDMVALDMTARPRPDGMSLETLISMIRDESDIPIMADIATLEEGITAAKLGIDVVATTLSDYSDYVLYPPSYSIRLIRDLCTAIDVPIISEGGVSTPEDAHTALVAGASSVVVGSMITRPHMITERFATSVHANFDTAPVAVLDIGGTKIAGAIITGRDTIIAEARAETPISDGASIINTAQSLITSLIEKSSIQPIALGVSTGGQINRGGHIVGSTGMLPDWIDTPLKDYLADAFGLFTHVLNDGHSTALAEARYGAGATYDSVLCVAIGTGLGGGLVVNGQLQHGENGLTGSIGQLKITRDGKSYVPLEHYVSGPGLVTLYNEQVAENKKLMTGLDLATRAQAGDKLAFEVVEQIGEWLGLGLSHALHTYDASCIVVGGSVAQLGDLLLNPARDSLKQHGHSTIKHTPILSATYGSKAGTIGAALFVRDQMRRAKFKH